jgi:hypothetical protein
VRQKGQTLREFVEQLARGEVRGAIEPLEAQGRVDEITDRHERFRDITREYARNPESTLVVSRDNQARTEINQIIHRMMQKRGHVDGPEHQTGVLAPRQDVTRADRRWAERYEPGDVVRYTKGSRTSGIEPGEYARVDT